VRGVHQQLHVIDEPERKGLRLQCY
jgi:hypothetical protein